MLRKPVEEEPVRKENHVVAYGCTEDKRDVVVVAVEDMYYCAYGSLLNFPYGSSVEESLLMPLEVMKYRLG